MKDNRMHYPKDPVLHDLMQTAFATTSTMCGARRDYARVTGEEAKVTCGPCIAAAMGYYQQQADTAEALLKYHDKGMLKGTSAEKEGETLIPKISEAFQQAREYIEVFKKRLAERS